MSVWRVIITDSESLSGVAPVCGEGVTAMRWQHEAYDGDGTEPFVYDCCPGPHIECYSMPNAQAVADALNAAEAEVCS